MSDRSKEIDVCVKPLTLLPLLKSNGVVTQKEYEIINRDSISDHQRVLHIVDVIISNGRNALSKFIAALKEEDQHPPHRRLAEMLEGLLVGSHVSWSLEPSLVDDVISPHLPCLVNLINPSVLILHLVRYRLVTAEEEDQLSNPTFTIAARNRYIFSQLYRCGPDAVKNFISCLIEEKIYPSHHELAEKLIQQLSTLEQHRELASRLEQALRDAGAEAQHAPQS